MKGKMRGNEWGSGERKGGLKGANVGQQLGVKI